MDIILRLSSGTALLNKRLHIYLALLILLNTWKGFHFALGVLQTAWAIEGSIDDVISAFGPLSSTLEPPLPSDYNQGELVHQNHL